MATLRGWLGEIALGDASPTLLHHAAESHPQGRHLLGDAGRLPLSDAAVDLVTAYCSLMDFDEMPSANRDGLEMTLAGWCHSIEEYSLALEAAGLVIEAIREPTPSTSRSDKRPGWTARWRRLPQFLLVRSVKSPASA